MFYSLKYFLCLLCIQIVCIDLFVAMKQLGFHTIRYAVPIYWLILINDIIWHKFQHKNIIWNNFVDLMRNILRR